MSPYTVAGARFRSLGLAIREAQKLGVVVKRGYTVIWRP